MEKTQLQKSHSVWSNTKLTVLTILTALFFNLFFVSLGLKNHLEFTFWIIIVVLSGGLSFLGLILFNAFKR